MLETIKKAKRLIARLRKKTGSIFLAADEIDKKIKVLEKEMAILLVAQMALEGIVMEDLDRNSRKAPKPPQPPTNWMGEVLADEAPATEQYLTSWIDKALKGKQDA